MQLQCTTQAYVAFVKHEDRRMHKHVTLRWYNVYIVILYINESEPERERERDRRRET